MTLVRFKQPQNDFFPSLSRVFEDFTSSNWFDSPARTSSPAVNVKETEKSFELEVAAPGLKKEDFNISLDEDILKISAERKTETTEDKEDERYSRREFSYQSFARSFSLPETVNKESIAASYNEGVLSITLPKVEIKEEPKVERTIEIA
ncbi:MAG: Hsp20/alpha crystallin family protein [Bacteroidota bacterium]